MPLHLRDASYPAAQRLGHGKGYRYPHDFPGHVVDQEYRPAAFDGHRYFEPSGMGEDVEPSVRRPSPRPAPPSE